MESWEKGHKRLMDGMQSLCAQISDEIAKDMSSSSQVTKEINSKLDQIPIDTYEASQVDLLTKDNTRLKRELQVALQTIKDLKRGERSKESVGLAIRNSDTDNEHKRDLAIQCSLSFESPGSSLVADKAYEQQSASGKFQADASSGRNYASKRPTMMEEQYRRLVEKHNKLNRSYVDLSNASRLKDERIREKLHQIKAWESWAMKQSPKSFRKDTIPPVYTTPSRQPLDVRTHNVNSPRIQPDIEATQKPREAGEGMACVDIGNNGPAYTSHLSQNSSHHIHANKRKIDEEAVAPESVRNVKIKLENIASSPVSFVALYKADYQDSMDLDEIGQKTDTPKKRARAYAEKHKVESLGKLFQACENGIEGPSNNLGNIIPRSSHIETFQLSRSGPLKPISPNKKIEICTTYGEHNQINRRLGEPNRMTIPSTDSKNDGKSIIGAKIEESDPIPSLSDEVDRNKRRIVQAISSKSEQLKKTRRDTQSLSKYSPRTRESKYQQRNTATSSKSENTINKNSLSTRALTTSAPKSTLSHEYGSNSSKPLRSWPIACLRLSHFKVNPNYNNGYDFAFSDVARKKADRRCLSGCTDPQCCGDTFRKLAELLARPQNKPDSESQEEIELQLLQEYLGDSRQKIKRMSKDEREELLLRARTRELANKAGKHRHSFERRSSPPGFWRTDFPSTQERLEDRDEAEKLERVKVERRYTEAIRPGGAWLFQDE